MLVTRQYGSLDHKHAPSMIDTDAQSYDENGNLISSSGKSFKYNAENQMVKVSFGSAYVARFISDGDGQRRKRVDNYGTVIYAGPHYERNVGTGTDTSDVTTKLYWVQLGPFRRLIAVRKGGALSFIHHDHLGSTKAISGTSGGPMKYYPYGSTFQEVQNPPTDNLYTGQKRDLSTGLYFYGARYFSPAIGMFLQPDSIVPNPGNPQSLNRLSYCLNNPLKYIDPSGSQEEEETYYVFVGGYGTTADSNHGDWDPMIRNLGLKGEGIDYGFFEWEPGWSGRGTASIERSAADAAPGLAKQIANHKNVTLVGHSKGGALIMEYLAQVAEGNIRPNENVKHAFTLDSPLGGDSGTNVASVVAKFDRYQVVRGQVPRDRLASLPNRLAIVGMAVDIATLDNPNDISGHSPIPGTTYESVPKGDWASGHRPSTLGQVHGLLMQSAYAAGYISWRTWPSYGAAW